MKTILFIAPHLSTGGLPQYLVKKVELLKSTYNIFVIEYDDITGGRLIIQKERIQKLLGDNLITIPAGVDKNLLIDAIDRINPDIIHFEELPEYFMGDDIASQIYKSGRSYKIFETCHDSSFNPDNKRFRPDKFILVSQYQVGMLAPLNVPSEVVEYPIEPKERPDRVAALTKLGLDPRCKHVLHVGLFTPRKNQAEFFEYAKKFENQKVIFHSIGNMADNFRGYWEPLMANKPKNVIIHGEKDNVDDYYAAMDLFLFTSRGTITDKETMPLVIREAISWNIPTLIYDLPVYQNYFDKYDSINYLDFNDFNKNIQIIDTLLHADRDETVVIISAYPTTKSSIDLTLKSIISAKEHGFDVILTSHAKVPDELQEKATYVIYDSNNILTHHDYYNRSWYKGENYSADLNLKCEDNHVYHGPAVYTNYYNGLSLAKGLGYKNAICYNFDMDITDENVYVTLINELANHRSVYNLTQANEGKALRTVLFATDIHFFLNNFKSIDHDYDYNNWKTKIGSESNGLENMFYHNLKNKLNSIKTLSDDEFYDLLKGCSIDKCSMVEYFTVLPTESQDEFVVWFSTSNSIDDRECIIEVTHNDSILSEKLLYDRLRLKGHTRYHKLFKFISGTYTITLTENRKVKRKIIVDASYMKYKISNNGIFKTNKKIRLVHLVTEPNTNDKEIRSINSLKDFCDKTDIEYYQLVNEIYKELPPKDNCARPSDVELEPGFMKLSPGHYGCFLAHKNGITLNTNKEKDIILIFEGDVIIDHDYNELYNNIIRWSNIANDQNIDVIGFGNMNYGHDGSVEDILLNAKPFIPAQSYLINKNKLSHFKDKFNNSKWDAYDLWLSGQTDIKMGITDKIYTKHLPGYSIIDKKIKNKDNDNASIFTE
jgi:glycosyltransferase involved in cell wall biosynthesis